MLNIIGTVGKIIPLFVFVIVLLFSFHFDKFDLGFISQNTATLGGLGAQLKSTMLVTLWAFIGIEGAVVLSSRAQKPSDVSKATIMGFAGCIVIYMLLSLLPFGFLTQAEIAAIPNPSTAGVLEKIVGPWGAWVMNIGLLVAVLTSWLAWTIITAEMPFAAAGNKTFPKQFAVENKNGSPSVSLWVTSILMQLAILLVYFSKNAWSTMLSITGVMVLPAYIASTLYLWKLTEDGEYSGKDRFYALLSGLLGTAYGAWLLYAAGLKYLFLAFIFIAAGIPVYIWARKQTEDKAPVFHGAEKLFLWAIIILTVGAIYAFSRGLIKL